MATGTPGQGARGRFGKFEVLAHLATGGMGAVYRARDTETGREVALKILPPELAAKPALRERFKREARAAAQLSHENIVALYEVGEINDLLFLALEYVDGIDLHHYVARRGPLEPDEARDILTQAARALAHFHEQGLVHRDIKPANFLIAHPDGRLVVKLTDLGLARAHRDNEFRVTRAGRTVGTIDYMAPEQARDSGRADIRSDLYALGCTLYHMLAGHAPFPDGSLSERVYKHAEDEPADISARRPEVPADLVAVLRRLLRKDPADRYQSPQELLDALETPPAAVESAEGPRVGILVAVKSSSQLKVPRTTAPKLRRPTAAPGGGRDPPDPASAARVALADGRRRPGGGTGAHRRRVVALLHADTAGRGGDGTGTGSGDRPAEEGTRAGSEESTRASQEVGRAGQAAGARREAP